MVFLDLCYKEIPCLPDVQKVSKLLTVFAYSHLLSLQSTFGRIFFFLCSMHCLCWLVPCVSVWAPALYMQAPLICHALVSQPMADLVADVLLDNVLPT